MEQRNLRLFNTPLELGLRTLFILNASYPNALDIDRLSYYDYILIHSSDVENGPTSIHPNLPHRSSEIFVKRNILHKGILLLLSKELIKIDFTLEGIKYQITEIGKVVVLSFDDTYSEELKKVSIWLCNKFENYDDNKLNIYMKNNVDKWGGEFTKESLFRDYEFK
jgi:hypothetical protein